MTIKMGLNDVQSRGISKTPFINAGKMANGKGKGRKNTSKPSEDGKYERMMDGATGHNDGTSTSEFDQMGVGEFMSTQAPMPKTESPMKKTRRQRQEREQSLESVDSNSLIHSPFPHQRL